MGQRRITEKQSERAAWLKAKDMGQRREVGVELSPSYPQTATSSETGGAELGSGPMRCPIVRASLHHPGRKTFENRDGRYRGLYNLIIWQSPRCGIAIDICRTTFKPSPPPFVPRSARS
jgi:hypothetical protein